MPFDFNVSDSLLGLYFLILSTAVAFEVTTIRLPLGIRLMLCVAIVVLSCYSFLGLMPTTYGKPWLQHDCEMSSRKFNCQLYPELPFAIQPQGEQQTVYADIFGDTYSIEYYPGEEEMVGDEMRKMKLEIWKSKAHGTKVKERYIGIQSTPAPKWNDVRQKRWELRNMMLNRFVQRASNRESRELYDRGQYNQHGYLRYY